MKNSPDFSSFFPDFSLADALSETAIGYAPKIGRQSLPGATQNAASSVGNDLAEGKAPDLNEAGKLATKGAIDGAVTGASLHPAVVPSERKSGKMVEAAGNGNKNAHTLPKHGKQTTLEQQKLRANEGIEPDGTKSFKTDSSKWLRNVDTADGIQVAKRRREEMLSRDPTLNGENIDIPLTFDKPVGKGYLKGSDTLIKSNKALFRFNAKGDLITSYPLLPKTKK